MLPMASSWPTASYHQCPPDGLEFLKTDAADSLVLA
jgi:hypothetical protein